MDGETGKDVTLLSYGRIYKVALGFLLRVDIDDSCSVKMLHGGEEPIFSVSFTSNANPDAPYTILDKVDTDANYVAIGKVDGKVRVISMKCVDCLSAGRLVDARMTLMRDIPEVLMDSIIKKSTSLYHVTDPWTQIVVMKDMKTLKAEEKPSEVSIERAIEHINKAISELEKLSNVWKVRCEDLDMSAECLRDGFMRLKKLYEPGKLDD